MLIQGIEYSDAEVARLLMTKLWRIYDAGGISMGRGLRAGLLESVIDIIPKVFGEVDEFLFDILEKIKNLSLSAEPIQLWLFDEVEFLPHDVFVGFVLEKLRQYYWVYGEDCSSFEKDILITICKLLRINGRRKSLTWPVRTYSAEALITEGKNRFRYFLRQKDQHRFFGGF